MDRIITFTRRKKPRNTRPLLKIDPEPAHGIVNAGEYPHRHVSRVVTYKHLVDLEDRTQTLGQNISRNVSQVEIDLIFAANSVALETDLEYLAGRDIAWDEIAVCGIFFFEKVPTLWIWNVAGRPSILRIARHPDAAAFAACGLTHQAEFV